MQALGPVQAKLLVSGAGPGPSLRAGALVSVEVLERLEPGLYRVAVGGFVLKARSPAQLVQGAVFPARVEREGALVALRALPGREDVLRNLLLASGLPDDALSRLAASALLREGVALEPRAVARVRRASSEAKDEDEAADRRSCAARLESKGIAADEAAVDALSFRGDGASGRGGGRRDGERPGGNQDTGRAPRSAGGAEELHAFSDLELDSGFERSLAPEKLAANLAALLRSLSLRSGGEGDLLSLFNHVRGPEGSWIHVPFAFELDSIAFSGSFRIKLPYAFGGSGRMEARFSVSRSGGEDKREWMCSLHFGGGRRPELALSSADPASRAAAARRLGSLERELSVFECSVSLADPYEVGESEGLDVDA